MKKIILSLVIILSSSMLIGCLDNGSSAAPPLGMKATAGDGRVKVEWLSIPGIEYWLFSATDAALSALNWTGLLNSHVNINAQTPLYICGLLSDDTYYFVANGRLNGGPGGTSSLQVNAKPYTTSLSWTNPAVASGVPSTINLSGIGYASLTTCSNSTISSMGVFSAVGSGGAVLSSVDDGQSWVSRVSPVTTDLYAVTGYTANQNNITNPAQLWVAVGAGGATIYSADSKTWTLGRMASSAPALNAIVQNSNTFVAVGDAGIIMSTTDGINWTTHPTSSTTNLHGITHGNVYVAVGDAGTILTSTDGVTWVIQSAVTSSNLRQVSSIGNIIVAVGDMGTIVTSKDSGATWVTKTMFGSPNLVSVSGEFHWMANDIVDGWLGVIPNTQFVIVDRAGNAYASQSSTSSTQGLSWVPALLPTGNVTSTGVSNLNALVSSGYGYIVVGDAGAMALSF